MKKKRGGFTLIETLVAGVILATAVTVAARMLIAAAAQRKALDAGQTALIEAGNVMERLAVEPWAKLDEVELSKWKLTPEANRILSGAGLEIKIEPIPGEPDSKQAAAKRITVVVSHGGGDGQKAKEVRLVAWRYEHIPVENEPKKEENNE